MVKNLFKHLVKRGRASASKRGRTSASKRGKGRKPGPWENTRRSRVMRPAPRPKKSRPVNVPKAGKKGMKRPSSVPKSGKRSTRGATPGKKPPILVRAYRKGKQPAKGLLGLSALGGASYAGGRYHQRRKGRRNIQRDSKGRFT